MLSYLAKSEQAEWRRRVQRAYDRPTYQEASAGLLNEDRIELLDSWKTGLTGFSAHGAVTVAADDSEGLERLARYLLRPPLALERLTLEPGCALYRHKAGPRRGETFDPDELLARLILHIPAPRLPLVHYFGEYSNVARARRRQAGAEGQRTIDAQASADDDGPPSAERKRLRRQWAELIRRIYEVDPLTCRCGAQMRILSFILDPRIVKKILRHIAVKATARERAPPSSAVAS